MTIPLGPFALERCIGHGGMAEVWRGRHREFPLAVKIMTSKGAKSEHFRTVFRGEVQAVAALRHPGIIEVLDHGVVGNDTHETSHGAIPTGNPYLAMELLSGATLLEIPEAEWSWERLREVLLALLAALAHAHARGVIHRDLKPSNVLIDESAPGGIKLADFGLAYAIDDPGRLSSSDDLVIGTPSCMAPEQIQGQWRDYGPWTDLYGVGCLAWELASGVPIFGGGGMLRVVRSHLEDAPGAFEPRIAVPVGFEAWLRRLLEKEPGRRFVRAADAAVALEELPDAAARPRRGREDPMPRRSPGELPDWRHGEPAPSQTLLLGAGLGLYGVREPSFVGREAERDRLWAALRDVQATGGTRAVVLRGAEGVGKTRLAEWLARRAHEAGAATVLRATHGEIPAPSDGLQGMMTRHFRCATLTHQEISRRIERLVRVRHVIEPAEWQRMADLVAGYAVPGDRQRPVSSEMDRHPPVSSESDRRPPVPSESDVHAPRTVPLGDERYALIERHLVRLNRQRAVLLVLDDCAWGLDTLAFAEFLLRRNHDGPLAALLVVTARDAERGDHVEAEHRLQSLVGLVGGEGLEIPPLDAFQSRRLARALLGLESDLVETVAERSGGNPSFAVQTVGDWIQRGILRPGARGFELEDGAQLMLPESLRQAWTERLEAVLDQPALEKLEVAAAIGLEMAVEEWREACAERGLALTPDGAEEMLDALLRAGLARRTEAIWSFAHGMVREILEQRARSAGRWAGHHAACARALLARADRPGGTAWAVGSLAERLGRHRFEAGEWEGCLVPLLNGARARRESSDYAAALRLLARREQALVALSHAPPAETWATRPVEIEATSPALLDAWAEGWALRARIHLHEGRPRDAQQWSEHASRAATPEIAAEAHRLLGDAARRMGELERAQALYRVAIAAEAGQHSTAASLCGLGDSLRQLGDTENAATEIERSRAIYAVIADVHGIADTALASGDLARHGGDLANAERCYRNALALFDGAGNRYGVARAWNGLGEASRLAGRYAVAESFYRRSAEALHDLGSADETFPRVNLALLELARGRADSTLEMLEEQWPRPRTLGWGGLLLFLSAAQFAAASIAHEWGTAEAALLEVTPDGRELLVCDPDLAITLEAGARACLGTAREQLGRRALALAIAQRVSLGDRDGEARLRALADG